MINIIGDESMKRILGDGVHEIPTEDFNERLIERYLSEQSKTALKPGINYTILLISVSLILFFSGIAIYLNSSTSNYSQYISDVENITEKIRIALLIISSYSIFNVLCDMLEDRKFSSVQTGK